MSYDYICLSQLFSGGRQITRRKWRTVEEDELKQIMANNFSHKLYPQRSEVQRARQVSRECGGLIHKRKTEMIRRKVYYMIKSLEDGSVTSNEAGEEGQHEELQEQPSDQQGLYDGEASNQEKVSDENPSNQKDVSGTEHYDTEKARTETLKDR